MSQYWASRRSGSCKQAIGGPTLRTPGPFYLGSLAAFKPHLYAEDGMSEIGPAKPRLSARDVVGMSPSRMVSSRCSVRLVIDVSVCVRGHSLLWACIGQGQHF
ncbi:hypothetical protein KIL84_008646 [Mauremys mutica]|uniref:Uncharacterized protein n=1 Tax=Mauremys mutica TaxID=74926 RepID=A0A9D3X8I8_9SAUR|nr:hypothetical protein KIL84_008646 [Mauremys mutica]